MFFFVPGKDLRAIIIECLKEGDKSISKITRDLKKEGHDYHRLVITGYLRAMADLGVIKEKPIPPSKVYSVVPNKSKNIYQLLGTLVKARNLGFKKEALLCAQALEVLFKRPIFLSELNMCGYDEPQGVRKSSVEERTDSKDIIANAGLKVGPKEPAYSCRKPYLEELEDVLSELVLEMSGTRALRKVTTQTTLNLQ
jgi:DNA-binding HxlR family transcriptional regulator